MSDVRVGDVRVIEGLEQIIEFFPAYDRGPGKDAHGVEMHCVLKGPDGAVTFLLHTNWYLPRVANTIRNYPMHGARQDNGMVFPCRFEPSPANCGVHSPLQTGEYEVERPCPYTPTGTCFFNGRYDAAKVVFYRLVKEGTAGLWAALEQNYREAFHAPGTVNCAGEVHRGRDA